MNLESQPCDFFESTAWKPRPYLRTLATYGLYGEPARRLRTTTPKTRTLRSLAISLYSFATARSRLMPTLVVPVRPFASTNKTFRGRPLDVFLVHMQRLASYRA